MREDLGPSPFASSDPIASSFPTFTFPVDPEDPLEFKLPVLVAVVLSGIVIVVMVIVVVTIIVLVVLG